MKRKSKVSISIVTRNRLFELDRCLKSILCGSILPDEVIVIDNDLEKKAKKIVEKRIFSSLHIKYYSFTGTVPKCRNKALIFATSDYLGFIDDDCVLHKHWVKRAKQLIQKFQPNIILGRTHLLNPNNLWALSQHARDAYWKEFNHQLFDTKNALVNLKKLKKEKLVFDEKCQFQFYDSADFDFDFQLRKKGWKRIYCSSMIVWHQETSKFNRFKKRAFARGYLAKYLDRKWNLNDTLVDRSTRFFLIWVIKALKNFRTDLKRYDTEMERQSFLEKLVAIFVIKLFEKYYIEGYEANT